jgi:hypothetical protein
VDPVDIVGLQNRTVHLWLSGFGLLCVVEEDTLCCCRESGEAICRDRQTMKKRTKSPSTSNKAVAAAAAAAVKEDLRRLREPPFLLYKEPSEPSFSEGLASVINLLKGRKNIAVLTGAGISVSCGIPDFRTKGSGLYSTLDTEVRCVCCGIMSYCILLCCARWRLFLVLPSRQSDFSQFVHVL